MKTKATLLIVGAISIPVMGIMASRYVKKVKSGYDFSFQGVQVTGIANGGINLDVSFLITNDTGMRLTVFDSFFNIYGNGTLLGVARQTLPQVVPDKMITRFVTKVTIDQGAVGSALFDYLFDKLFKKSALVNLAIQGIVKIQVNAPLISMYTINKDVNEIFTL